MAKGWSFGALTEALKGAAFLDIGTVANSVAAGNDGRIVNALQKGNNLSDVADITTARNTLFAAYRNGDANIDFYCRNNGADTAAVNNQRLEFRLQSKAGLNGDSNVDFYCRNNGSTTAAVNNERLDFRLQSKADTSGNEFTPFKVGGATVGNQAVRLDQFQAGDNGNGHWFKAPGGSQWCRTNMTLPAKGSGTWTFPAGFVSAPAVFITNINGSQAIWPTGVGPNNVSFYNDNSSPSNVNLLAIW